MTFQFALIADTHIMPERDDIQSPWRTMRLVNARARFAVAQIRAARPDFVIHLGDKVHPTPALDAHPEAVQAYKRIFEDLDCPLYTIPGNHDVGDKPRAWMPATVANAETLQMHQRQFGPDHFAFSHQGCRFVLLNNPVFNSGLPQEAVQRSWLEDELAAATGERLFLCMHYPAFLVSAQEPGHYENLDEPARSWLLDLLVRWQVEAVFSGHTHHFFYNRHGNTRLYTVPSVGFLRQDYAELFRVGPEPDAEWGRDDTGKFGWALVTVDPGAGHHFRFIASGGQVQESEPDAVRSLARTSQPADDPTRPHAPAAVGVDLRHAWAELAEFPFNYLPDEFSRKQVRNDYPVLALWRLGIQRVRVPVSDLLDPRLRARMADLHAQGYTFLLFSLGAPGPASQEVLAEARHMMDGLEIILPWNELSAVTEPLQSLRQLTRVPVFFSPLLTSSSALDGLSRGVYFVRHGFQMGRQPLLDPLLKAAPRLPADGFSFRAGEKAAPGQVIEGAAQFAHQHNVKVLVHVQLASDATAGAITEEAWIQERVRAAEAAAASHPEVRVYLDTFVDMDRGYFVRHGLVDRRYNLRAGGRALREVVDKGR